MADEKQNDQPKELEDKQDTATALSTKFVVALLSGPKISAFLAHAGLNIDPLVASIFIINVLHKLHGYLKSETGWDWL